MQDVLGVGRGSESAPNSPKKRMLGNSATTKARNALAQNAAALQKAEKEAAAHAAQIASRETRALQRHKATATSKRGRLLHKASNAAKPTVRTTKKTVINLKRKVPVLKAVSKPGALKPVKNLLGKVAKASRAQKPSKAALLVNRDRSATPESSGSPSEESPNITPASLRSANKKILAKTTQIKPLRLSKAGKFGQRTLVADSDEEMESDSEEEEVPDSDVDAEYGKAVANAKFKGKKRGSAPAPRGIHKTGAGVAKVPRGRVRNAKGRFEPKTKA